MSAPPSGSANGSTPAGYYPDPSIPGYVRYWDGTAWVPGTSRPEPRDGDPTPEPPPGVAKPPESAAPAPAPAPAPKLPETPEETGPVFLDEEPADDPEAEPALPEPRVRGEADGPADEPVTDWDDPSRAHGTRPEPATAWQADASRQSGFGGEKDHKVSWGTDEDYSTSPVLGAGRTPRAGGQRGADPRGADPRGGWQRAADPAPKDSERDREPGQSEQPQHAVPADKAAKADKAETARKADEAGTPGTPDQAASSGKPVRENTTKLRRADIQAARAAAQSAPASAASSAPPATSQPPWAQQVHDLAHQVPPQAAPPAAQPTQPAQPAVPAQPQAPQAHQAPQFSQPAEPGPVTPWKPPVNDPFLQAAQTQARPAGLGRRFLARLIDGIVLSAVGAAVALPLLPRATDHIQAKVDAAEQAGVTREIWLIDATTGGYLALVLGALLVFGVLYEALPNARWGRTLGKKLCGVKVLDLEQQTPPGFGAALLRWLLYGVLAVVAVGVVNAAWCLFDKPWRQCWHDKAARTFVARD